jgi:hypothetical protein
MKNLLQITSAGEDLLGTVDDGTNRLFINDTEIASSAWTGTGSYTGSFSGHTITIAKIADTSGNVAIRKTGTYTYELYDQISLEYLPLTGGTLTGQVIQNYQGADGFMIEHGVANTDASVRAKRTDTGVGVMFGVGSGGINHGVYSEKLGKWLVYGDASSVHVNGDAENVSGTVAVGHGGSGKTNATDAANVFLDALTAGTSTPVDGDTYIASYADGKNASHTGINTYHRRPISELFNYIKNKLSPLPVANGGTGATSETNARNNLKVPYNIAEYFTTVTSWTKSCFLHLTANATIDNVTIPIYSKGVLSTNGSNDATLYAIDTTGTLYSAFRNNGSWSRARKYGSTSLWNGTLGSSAVTITNAMKYDRLIFVAQIGSNPYFYSPLVVPTYIIGSSDQGYEVADDSSYVSFNLKSSGNNVIMTRRGGTNTNCTIYRVIGVN